MKLLTPSQGRSRKEIETASQELRSIQLDEVVRQKRKEIGELEALALRTLSDNGKKNYEEEKLWKEKIRVLAEEVVNLEERRRRALVPLEEREKELENKTSALLKREETVVIKESDLEYKSDALEDKLDAVSEREQEAETYSQRLNNREFALKLQEEDIRTRMDALTTILQESLDDIQKGQAENAKYKAILKGRDISITEREKVTDAQQASFDAQNKRILDRYRTLQRAITETNLKKRAQ